MRSVLFASVLAACLSQPISAQESLADQKTQLEIERLEQQVRAAELEALATIRAINGSSATVDTPAETAESMTAKYLVYDQAFNALAKKIPAEVSGAEPVIVFGTEPPSLSAWFVHDENAKNTAKALLASLRQWSSVRTPGEEISYALAPALAASIISTVVALVRVETTIQGSALKAEEATLEGLLSSNLADGNYAIRFDEFEPSRDGLAHVDELLERELEIISGPASYGVPDKVSLKNLKDRAVAAYQKQFLPNKSEWEAQLATAVEEGNASKAEKLRAALSGGSNLATSITLFNKLQTGLLASTKGALNATHIVRVRDLAQSNSNVERPIIYILSHEAALTTLTRKGALLGLRSIPATVRVGTRIEYLYAGSVLKRGSVACLSDRTNIDRVSAIAGNCVAS